MKELPLTKGKVAVIDDGDFDSVGRFKWSYSHGYAKRYNNGRMVYLHREIMNPPAGKVIDHIDGDGLNNSRSNLQVCSQAVNMQKAGLSSRNISGFRGVSIDRRCGKWMAQIQRNGKVIYLGRHNSPQDANAAIIKYKSTV